ncbi:MAG: ATP-binding protein [Verrucomicrobiota bacterium]|jgi:two-component system sensor histidine kinase HydH
MPANNSAKKIGGAKGSSQWDTAPVSEQSMRRLDRLASLGLLSAGMAHEIKNSLVAVNTFVGRLLQNGEDQEFSETVRRELRRIDTLVNQMLRFAAPGKNEFAAVHVHDLLDHSLRLVEHQLKARSISLNRHYAAAPDTVRGDEYQLQQAFMNLLFNAIEAAGMNGTLTLSTEIAGEKPRERRVRIHIQDTGMGIPPENLSRLFEPFFTTKKSGTGLGLAICQRIVHEHDGDITAQSEVKKGATFSISLPAISS